MRKLLPIFLAILLCLLPLGALAEEELLINGDFTQGGTVPKGWAQSRWTEDDLYTTFAQGENDEVGHFVSITSTLVNDARYEQTLEVEPDTVYRISGLVQASDVAEGRGANISVANTFAYSDSYADTYCSWAPVELYVRTGQDQKEMTLYLRLGGYGQVATGYAAFAQISVQKAPEDVDEELIQFIGEEESSQDGTQSGISVTHVMLMSIIIGIMAIWVLLRRGWMLESPAEKTLPKYALWILLAVALAVRLAVSANTAGFSYDISCWKSWCQLIYKYGPAGFYTSGVFADYPPLYMLILYPVGLLHSLLNLDYDSKLFMLLIKLPSVLADLAAGWMLFRIASRRFRDTEALAFTALYLFNPAVFINASIWGQVDALLALMMVAVLDLLWEKKWIPACGIMAAGLLFKPQMLFIAPMFLPALITLIKEEPPKVWIRTLVLSLLTAVWVALAIILPFSGGRPLTWIAELYTSTIGSYPYGSVNAANLPALLGGNWVSDSNTVLGLSYKIWGYFWVVVCIAGTMVLCLRDKEKNNGYFYAALLIAGIFTLAHSMHERYIFPVLLLLAVSYAITGKKLHLYSLAAVTVSAFLNQALILAENYLPTEGMMTPLTCLIQVAGFAFMVAVAVFQSQGKELPLPKLTFRASAEEKTVGKLSLPTIPAKPVAKWERWAALALTAVYALVALIYLGKTQVPQSQWVISDYDQTVVVDLGEDHSPVATLWQYRSLSSEGASLMVEESLDGEDWSPVTALAQTSSEANDVFKWYISECPCTRRYLRITFTRPLTRMLEMAFKDEENNVLPVTVISSQVTDPEGPAKLFDEQDLVPEAPSQMDQTYFDEIYHARTAWEYTQGLYPYETTHPPLGKLIIALGIEIFGMTPFGWRVMGALFGIFMVPLMYFLARAIFKDGRFAFGATWMLTWDLMHFAHSRIATIDIFAVFWIMLMFFFMFRYLAVSHAEGMRKKRLIWLACCGLSFGLGCATKWICCYAGVGLALIYFGDLIGFGLKNRKSWSEKGGGTGEILLRLGWCCIFFVALPLVIYCVSYIPFMTDGVFRLSTVWKNQTYMFDYHANLTATHFFSSPWYQWPLIIKPIWMYQNTYLGAGQMGTIASFGNPAVWWPCALAMAALLILTLLQKGRDRVNLFLCIGFLAQFLPWVLVTRCTFIYHYFASVPFIILALMRLWQLAEARWPKARLTRWMPLYLAAVLLLFIFFYPAVSGMPVSSAYGKLMDWLPLWYFSY